MTVDPTPEEFRGVTPHMVVDDAGAAVEYYRAAFDADLFRTAHGPDGRVWHMELLIGGGRILLFEEYPEMGMVSPAKLPGTAVMLHLFVADTDETFAKAVAAGGTALMEPWDSFWGDRYAQVRDPFGHRWAIATRREDLDEQETLDRGDAYKAAHPNAPTN